MRTSINVTRERRRALHIDHRNTITGKINRRRPGKPELGRSGRPLPGLAATVRSKQEEGSADGEREPDHDQGAELGPGEREA